MLKAAIIGTTGYTGIELLRILKNHPEIEVTAAVTETYAGQMLEQVYPHLKNIINLQGEKFYIDRIIQSCDLIFIALPHGHAATMASPLLAAGKKVIDLGADFRLKNGAEYNAWYQHSPANPELLAKAVYGLTEIGWREAIVNCNLLANPGCYPTAAVLAIAPLLTTDWIDIQDIIFDGKSGVSGAGRTLALNNHFCEVMENFKAYQIAGTHRHTPEIEQTISTLLGKPITVQFTPHLVPMVRGLFMTAYFKLKQKISQQQLQAHYQEYYKNAPFIRLMNDDVLPQTKFVYGTNYCDIAVRLDTRTQRIIAMSAIDNLVKGASGQAVQNMNLMYGFPETLGLDILNPIYP